ncbi:MAG: hypothetical protein ACXV4C_10840 [Halobacteriota archaeon]
MRTRSHRRIVLARVAMFLTRISWRIGMDGRVVKIRQMMKQVTVNLFCNGPASNESEGSTGIVTSAQADDRPRHQG